MTEFKHQKYGMTINVTAAELDRPQRLRDPIWRALMVSMGLARPRYGMTMREQLAAMQQKQMEMMRRAADIHEARLGLASNLDRSKPLR